MYSTPWWENKERTVSLSVGSLETRRKSEHWRADGIQASTASLHDKGYKEVSKQSPWDFHVFPVDSFYCFQNRSAPERKESHCEVQGTRGTHSHKSRGHTGSWQGKHLISAEPQGRGCLASLNWWVSEEEDCVVSTEEGCVVSTGKRAVW